MSQYTELTVYKDVYALVLLLFQYTKDFPREYKYSLGQDIKRDFIQLVRSIYNDEEAEPSVYDGFRNSVNSYLGICSHYDTFDLRGSVLGMLNPRLLKRVKVSKDMSRIVF